MIRIKVSAPGKDELLKILEKFKADAFSVGKPRKKRQYYEAIIWMKIH